jgi:hypothetical protein
MKEIKDMSFEELNNEIQRNDPNTKELARQTLYDKYLKRLDNECKKNNTVFLGIIGVLLLSGIIALLFIL